MDETRLLRIRPPPGSAWRFAGAVLADVARSAVGERSLVDVAAAAIIRAPSAGRKRPLPPGKEEWRIEAGSPRVMLSVAVVEAAGQGRRPDALDLPAAPSAMAPRGTVFVLHGIRDSKESIRGWAEIVSRAGYRAVLVDLRGHGRSTGDVLSYGVREARDLVDVLDAVAARGDAAGPVGAMGFSYGAAIALQWAGVDPRVEAVVGVAPFASLREVARGYLPLAVPSSFVDRAVALAGRIGAFDPDEASPERAVTRTRARVLLVHGTSDARVASSHSERIYAARPEGSSLVLVDGAGHEGVVTHPEADLARRATAWLRHR